MKKLLLLFTFIFFIISCQAQNEVSLPWKEFESIESSMRVQIPCEPKKYFKSFQDQPRPIHVYSFNCEVNGLKFLISSKHYMDEFNDKTFKQTFDAHESNLKTMFGEVESFNERKDFLTNGFDSKYYQVKLKSGAKINQLVVVSKTRSYDAMFVVTPEKAKESNTNYEKIGERFIDSFQVLEK
jgi:hypothetical protein